jgi:DNA-binding response OmpR family regulator
MDKTRILVIEDDAAIRTGLLDALALGGFAASSAPDGTRGLEAALTTDWDLLLLDLMLPGMNGLDILEHVRESRPGSPVIILTARGDENDRVKGLRLGADDYVVKPFGARELLARVEAVLRRSPARPRDIRTVQFTSGMVDLDRREVRFSSAAPDETRPQLSELEAELLAYLARNPTRAISREELLSHVWRVDPRGIETRTVDMHVARLREKLRDDPVRPRIILTVRGKGYMLAAPPDGASG